MGLSDRDYMRRSASTWGRSGTHATAAKRLAPGKLLIVPAAVLLGTLVVRLLLRHGWIASDRFQKPVAWSINGQEMEWLLLAAASVFVLAFCSRNRRHRGVIAGLFIVGSGLAGWSLLSPVGESEVTAWWAQTKQRVLWRGPNGEGMEEAVHEHGAVIVKPDGRPVQLLNNPDARNPSWSELVDFLRRDNTDQRAYIPGRFVCSSFAEMLHNRIEAAGYRCAYVTLNLPEGHACNVFETTDRGRVFIDCTGKQGGRGPARHVCIVEVGERQVYNPSYLFESDGWTCEPMGVARDINIQW